MNTYIVYFEGIIVLEIKGDNIEFYDKSNKISIFKNIDNCHTEVIAILSSDFSVVKKS